MNTDTNTDEIQLLSESGETKDDISLRTSVKIGKPTEEDKEKVDTAVQDTSEDKKQLTENDEFELEQKELNGVITHDDESVHRCWKWWRHDSRQA